MKTKTIFIFDGIESLHAEMDGKFFLDGKLCRKTYVNGTIQIRHGKFSKGLKTLRKIAIKKKVEETKFPF